MVLAAWAVAEPFELLPAFEGWPAVSDGAERPITNATATRTTHFLLVARACEIIGKTLPSGGVKYVSIALCAVAFFYEEVPVLSRKYWRCVRPERPQRSIGHSPEGFANSTSIPHETVTVR
jgi:hypothetical protein